MNLVETALGLITSTTCRVCGLEGENLCEGCRADIEDTAASACFRCNKLTKSFKTCQNCRRYSKLSAVWAATYYEEPIAGLIKELKFDSNRSIAGSLAKILESRMPFDHEDWILVPVPTALSRKRRRGFDQAELLASSLSVSKRMKMLKALVRTTGSRQVGATRKQRLANTEGMFRSVNQYLLAGQKVLLVDDVITTGATLSAAAQTLKEAGAKKIEAIVIARD